MMIFETSCSDQVHNYAKSIVVLFKGNRKVLSTSCINGGFREDLTSIFNHDGKSGAGMACVLRAPTYEEHMMLIAEELGLDKEHTAGMSTAASMENVSIKVKSFNGVAVTAIVTGGVEVNGGRAGDPSSYYEKDGEICKINGTINIILIIDANLPEYTMARSLITCTEAKTAALQELIAGSNYSTGIATGSGTDNAIIVCNVESPILLKNAGKHSKLGELIGVAVKDAVKEALYKQTGLSPQFQHSILNRFKRYGVSENSLWDIYVEKERKEKTEKAMFIHNLHVIERENNLVTLTSLYIHLLDQIEWGLLNNDEAIWGASIILEEIEKILDVKGVKIENKEEENLMKNMIKAYEEVIAEGAGKR
ncbi:adenosylcobinamide amidohydrolase [Aceticella autotrophica]|uniref:Adenosylcobinamide amidohydrolase n=1 Tax=Aceticella autotrophica TaxID=2755338 RepID=A0A975AUT9_9THEO|nr:adenosylcobinamide amidohydrolase [Aceticella autotrophica]QSZ26833.1 adenosylcobinamide amidohydrolase [Aceticella autotrophica]